jgi:signal transduction histidine kinase
MSDLAIPSAAAIVEALPYAAALFDGADALVAANGRFLALAGLDADGARGRPLSDALPAARADLRSAAAGASKGRVEIVRGAAFRHDGGDRCADVYFTPLDGGAGGVVVTALEVSAAGVLPTTSGAVVDAPATESRRFEDRTRELIAQAHDRRLAAVGQLASGVMHDVNNALNPIVAAAFLLEARAEDPDAVRDYARRIARAAESGAASAARVGRFIRQEPTRDDASAPVDLSALADEVSALTRPLWAERSAGGVVRFERFLQPRALVRGDAGELREAILQLVQNALEAMPEGGRLTLRTASADDEVLLEVADTGVGMDADVRERAFDPFFSTKSGGGSGLGLAEVYGIVRRHRGRAEIDSAPGAGTTVRLHLPALEPHDRSQPGVRSTRAPRRVLLVEDHHDGRELMRAVLERDGHQVEAVGSLGEAFARLDEGAGDSAFDVVVTDLGLPDGSGWELVARARARWPGLRVGVVTGWEPAVPTGAACDFTIRKPIEPAALLERVAG